MRFSKLHYFHLRFTTKIVIFQRHFLWARARGACSSVPRLVSSRGKHSPSRNCFSMAELLPGPGKIRPLNWRKSRALEESRPSLESIFGPSLYFFKTFNACDNNYIIIITFRIVITKFLRTKQWAYVYSDNLMLQFAKYCSAAFGIFFYRPDVSRFQTTVDHLATVSTLPERCLLLFSG